MDRKMGLAAYRRILTMFGRLPQPDEPPHVDEFAARHYGGNREGDPIE